MMTRIKPNTQSDEEAAKTDCVNATIAKLQSVGVTSRLNRCSECNGLIPVYCEVAPEDIKKDSLAITLECGTCKRIFLRLLGTEIWIEIKQK